MRDMALSSECKGSGTRWCCALPRWSGAQTCWSGAVIVQVAATASSGAQFMVHPEGFLVHRQHTESKSRKIFLMVRAGGGCYEVVMVEVHDHESGGRQI